jgi:chromosome segregation ATPase
MPRPKNQNKMGQEPEPDFSSRLSEAKEQLQILREQQELIEREKSQLEELKGLTESLETEKRFASERLASAISALEKKEQELRINQQETLSIKNELENAADEIQIAEKKAQKIDDVKEKIAFEKQAVETAKAVLNKAAGKLDIAHEKEYDFEDDDEGEYEGERIFPNFSGFMEGFKLGVGFFSAGLAAAVIFYVIFLLTGR